MPIVNGTTYKDTTPQEVIDALEAARIGGYRIKISYGDTDTGLDWEERYNTEGRVARSTGPVKVPILLANKRSTGGPAILDHCIVRIRYASKRNGRGDLYRHPLYHKPGRPRQFDLPAETATLSPNGVASPAPMG